MGTQKETPNQRLKQFRERAGLRQEAIAAELDLSVSLLQKLESGGKEISDKMAEALFRRYSLPFEWLMQGKGELTYTLEKENPYRDALYKELRDQVDFLKETIRAITGKANFLKLLSHTGQHKRRRLSRAA